MTSDPNPSLSAEEDLRRRSVIVPIPASEAAMIDEGRRALLARITGTAMLPAPQDLQMATYQTDRPVGVQEVEIHHILVTFMDDAPPRRARVKTMLESHFNRPVRLSRAAGGTWRYTINGAYQMDFCELDDVHDAIFAIAAGEVEISRIQGLFVPGLFLSEKPRSAPEIFLVSGDVKDPALFQDAA